MQNDDRSAQERPLVSIRTMEIAVALLFLLVSGIVIYGSLEVGIGWIEFEGPSSGFFPFYVSLILAAASVVNLVRALLRVEPGGAGIFVSVPAFGRVLTVAIPLTVYVALITGISLGPIAMPRVGIYLASIVFILAFAVLVGSDSFLKATVVAFVAPVLLYVVFEKHFLVLLPKCNFEFCMEIEERLVGAPYDKLREGTQTLFENMGILPKEAPPG
jgi:hypothetical protein